MNLKEALEIITIPSERYARLWINRDDAEGLWELLKKLYDAEQDAEESRVYDKMGNVRGWKTTETCKLSVPEPEETPPTTALDRDGEYTIEPLPHENLVRYGSQSTSAIHPPGWYVYPTIRAYHFSRNPKEHGHFGPMWGPIPEERVREFVLSNRLATEAQEHDAATESAGVKWGGQWGRLRVEGVGVGEDRTPTNIKR